jgi:hypothetical protein
MLDYGDLIVDKDGNRLPAKKIRANFRAVEEASRQAPPIYSPRTPVCIVPTWDANVTRLQNISVKDLLDEYAGMVHWAIDRYTYKWQPWQRANEWDDLQSVSRIAVWEAVHHSAFRGESSIATYIRQAVFHALSKYARDNMSREALGITGTIEPPDQAEHPLAQTDLMDALRDTPNAGLVFAQAMGFQDKELGVTGIGRVRRGRAKQQLARTLSP